MRKGLEEFYSTVLFLKTLTETITIKNVKPTLELGMSMKIFFIFHDILYVVGQVLKNAIEW